MIDQISKTLRQLTEYGAESTATKILYAMIDIHYEKNSNLNKTYAMRDSISLIPHLGHALKEGFKTGDHGGYNETYKKMDGGKKLIFIQKVAEYLYENTKEWVSRRSEHDGSIMRNCPYVKTTGMQFDLTRGFFDDEPENQYARFPDAFSKYLVCSEKSLSPLFCKTVGMAVSHALGHLKNLELLVSTDIIKEQESIEKSIYTL